MDRSPRRHAVFRMRPAGGVAEGGIAQPDSAGGLVQHLGEAFLAARDRLGQHDAGVVAGLDDDAARQILHRDAAAEFEEHARSAHADRRVRSPAVPGPAAVGRRGSARRRRTSSSASTSRPAASRSSAAFSSNTAPVSASTRMAWRARVSTGPIGVCAGLLAGAGAGRPPPAPAPPCGRGCARCARASAPESRPAQPAAEASSSERRSGHEHGLCRLGLSICRACVFTLLPNGHPQCRRRRRRPARRRQQRWREGPLAHPPVPRPPAADWPRPRADTRRLLPCRCLGEEAPGVQPQPPWLGRPLFHPLRQAVGRRWRSNGGGRSERLRASSRAGGGDGGGGRPCPGRGRQGLALKPGAGRGGDGQDRRRFGGACGCSLPRPAPGRERHPVPRQRAPALPRPGECPAIPPPGEERDLPPRVGGAAIVDAHEQAAAGLQIGHPHHRRQLQRAMGGHQRIRIVDLPIRPCGGRRHGRAARRPGRWRCRRKSSCG